MDDAPRHTASGKERRAIRAALHGEKPAVRIGRSGLDAGVIRAAAEAIRAREAIKIAVGHGCPLDPLDVARRLAAEIGAEVVGSVGRTALLYRPEETDG